MSEQSLRFSTPQLVLVATLPGHLEAELDSPGELGGLLGARVPESWPPGLYDRDAMEFFRGRYEEEGEAAIGWYGWYAILPAAGEGPGELVGCGGYFGSAAADGTVEIGYSIIPEAYGRGYGSELARGLSERALAMPHVRRVIAHTAHDNVASQKVLARAGFVAVEGSPEVGNQRFERLR